MEKIVNILAPEKNVYNLLTQYLANADFEYNLINELPSTPYEDELKWGIANTFLYYILIREVTFRYKKIPTLEKDVYPTKIFTMKEFETVNLEGDYYEVNSRFENDDNLELRRRYDEYRKSQGQFTIEDVRDFFDNGHSHNRGNTHIVDHLLEEQYENEVWVLDTLEEYSKEYNKKTVKGTFAARLCHLWDDDFSEEDIYERLEKYGFNLENTTFYPLMKEQLFILNNHLRINSHKLINTVFSPYQEFEHIKFDNAQDNAENYSRYSDDLADEIARDEEWNCDICNGNNETGCLYFDPTECPKLT